MNNIFTPEDLGKYESMIVESALMMKNKGLVEMGQLYAKYLDVLEEVMDDAVKAGNFLSRVWNECGKPPKLAGSEILEPFNDFRITNLGKLRPYHVRILSCKRVFTKNYRNEVEEKIIGFLELNGERFRYTAPYELPVDELVVWAIPVAKEKKKNNDMLQIVFEVWGYEEIYGDYGLTSVEVLDEEFRDLKSIRECYVKIVDEDVNIALSVLALASRLNKQRDFWIMGIVLQGKSSSGKSYLMSNVLRPWSLLGKVYEFTRFTGAYLERKFSNINHNLDDTIFAIYELFSNTPQQLHLTLSEGKLRVGVVDKETGEPIEFEFQGMPFMFSTTPMEGIREDLRNRIINISIDESDEQTKKILEFETRLAKDPNYADNINKLNESNMRRLAKYIGSLEKKYVIVPYADRLFEALTFWDVKLRRDWKKLLSLLHASALLFQKHRPKIKLENGEEAVVATLEDFENLLYVMPAFEETLIDLTKKEKLLFEIMRNENAEEYSTKELVILAHRHGWRVSDRRIRQVLDDLIGKGYVVVEKRGQSNYYSIVRNYEKVELEKVKDKVVEDLKAFAEKHGLEDSEIFGNLDDSAEKPASKPQKREIDHSEETEIETQRVSSNSIETGLATTLSIPVSISSESEKPASNPQNAEISGNREISENFQTFRNDPTPFINSPIGSPQAGARNKEVDRT